MHSIQNLLAGLACCGGLLAGLASASELPQIQFSHHDWELVCDNTRTCRAAGYQADEDALTLSVLLTRRAGPEQAVTGQLMLGAYGEDGPRFPPDAPDTINLELQIDGKAIGHTAVVQGNLLGEIPNPQLTALLHALRRDSRIEWVAFAQRFHLSDKGASAVLLKMDEFQGRLGTPGALTRPGERSESEVLPALPVPQLFAAPLAPAQAGDADLLDTIAREAMDALRLTTNEDDCPLLFDPEPPAEMRLLRLSGSQLLVTTTCWHAAYNVGSGFWVIHAQPPYTPTLVTTMGTDISGTGSISAAHKSRGLGDCWTSNEWTWNGERYVHSAAISTGMCKLIAPGGAWQLPSIVMDVRPGDGQQ